MDVATRESTEKLAEARRAKSLCGRIEVDAIERVEELSPVLEAQFFAPVKILPDADMILLMSVNPGFGGQEFIPSLYRRAATLSQWIHTQNLNCLIEADGGIKIDNIADVYAAGVDAIVSGSGIFGAKDPSGMIGKMKEACKKSESVLV